MLTNSPRTYRATMEAWVGQFLLPVMFLSLAAVTAVTYGGLNPWWAGGALAVTWTAAVFQFLVPMFRNYLHLDARSIEGSLNGSYFMVYWTEVLAAWLVDRRGSTLLCIGTRTGTLVIPLRFFDSQAVWQRVRANVPPSALEPCAIQRLPDYQELARAGETAARSALEENADPTADVQPVTDHWLLQACGWPGLMLCLYFALSEIRAANYLAAAIYLILSGGTAAVLLNWGITEFSTRGVLRRGLLRNWEIRWDEMRSIELDPNGLVIAFTGENCQVVIPGPVLWNRSGKKAAQAVLLAQAERRRIPIRRSVTAVFKSSHKSRPSKR